MESTDFTVDISKEFSVSVEKLYDSWINPEKLKSWWKPMHKNLIDVANDVNDGGIIKYAFDDNTLIIEGKYIEVKKLEKLVYTWNWRLPNDEIKDSSYQLTVAFSGNDNTSAIHILQENFKDEEGTLPHREGWIKGLNDLEKYLERK
ncbi:MAG: SRPBCC domain-containing protein [Ferruginibacter sp.]